MTSGVLSWWPPGGAQRGLQGPGRPILVGKTRRLRAHHRRAPGDVHRVANLWSTTSTHPSRGVAALHRDYDMVLTQLQRREHAALWIDILEARLFAGEERSVRIWSKLRTMIDAAVRLNIPVAVAGVRHKAWMHPAVVKLREDHIVTESRHRWCHFGIKLSPGQQHPSCVCCTVLSHPAMANHRCQCPPDTEHIFDLDKAHGDNRRKLRGDAEARFHQKLIASLGLVLGPSPGTSSAPDSMSLHAQAGSAGQPMIALPTDQAIRAKELKQERKITGAVAVKRKKFVEDHHDDDCGHDLTGLQGIGELAYNSNNFDDGNSSDSDEEIADPDHWLHRLSHSLTMWSIRGSEAEDEAPPLPAFCFIASDVDEMMTMLSGTPQPWGRHRRGMRRRRQDHLPLRQAPAHLWPQLRAPHRLRLERYPHADHRVGLLRCGEAAGQGHGADVLAIRPVREAQPGHGPRRLEGLL